MYIVLFINGFYFIYKSCFSCLIYKNKPFAVYLLGLLFDIPKYFYALEFNLDVYLSL